MSNHTPASHDNTTEHPEDVIETVAHKMSYMLPIAGAILIFLLAFIAVNVA
jgi:nucleoside permease NupC